MCKPFRDEQASWVVNVVGFEPQNENPYYFNAYLMISGTSFKISQAYSVQCTWRAHRKLERSADHL